MYSVKKITDDIYWVGGSDRRLALFENVYPLPDGVSYNSYVIMDEKTVLLDTADKAISGLFFENLAHVLDGRTLDYVVVNHMEPDHAATLAELVLRYPDVKIIGNSKTVTMIKQFFDFDIDSRAEIVKEGDKLSTGRHCLAFIMAPMVHWPEVMVTYDTESGTLFSADAFGTFGALSGNIFADEVDFEHTGLAEARRYYGNIVGKYGMQVQSLLKKAAVLDIKYICPLHGYVWRENIEWFIGKYADWSSYTPEDNGVVIAYGSVYGGTENAAYILAGALSDKGVKNITMFDASKTHPSYIIGEIFRAKCLVMASSTYNMGIFTPMETLLADIKAHQIQNRVVAVIENGTWAAQSGKLIRETISAMKNMTVLEQGVSLKSTVKPSDREQLELLADAVAQAVK